MALQLFYHPFSSYCQKVLTALYENAIPFEPQLLEGPDSPAGRRLAELWPDAISNYNFAFYGTTLSGTP